jgi:hypothetical protein
VRVILDTNLLVRALIRRNSIPDQILEAWFEDRFILRPDPALSSGSARQSNPRTRGTLQIWPPPRSEDSADDFLLA